MSDERQAKTNSCLSLVTCYMSLVTAFPPPTKWIISSWSFSSSCVCGHSVRRTTSRLRSTARRSGMSERWRIKLSMVRLSGTSRWSPLIVSCKTFASLSSALLDDAPQLCLVAVRSGAHKDGCATASEMRQLDDEGGDAVRPCLALQNQGPKGRA
jgi:hypothetical protein